MEKKMENQLSVNIDFIRFSDFLWDNFPYVFLSFRHFLSIIYRIHSTVELKTELFATHCMGQEVAAILNFG